VLLSGRRATLLHCVSELNKERKNVDNLEKEEAEEAARNK
jgi:hypothetical protein